MIKLHRTKEFDENGKVIYVNPQQICLIESADSYLPSECPVFDPETMNGTATIISFGNPNGKTYVYESLGYISRTIGFDL